jgi:dynactin-6
VVVETHAVVEGQVGEGTLVEARAHVGPGAVVGRYCHIGVFCEVKAGEVVPDHTVVYGEGLRRVDGSGRDGARGRNVRSMVETLRVIVGSKPEKFM